MSGVKPLAEAERLAGSWVRTRVANVHRHDPQRCVAGLLSPRQLTVVMRRRKGFESLIRATAARLMRSGTTSRRVKPAPQSLIVRYHGYRTTILATCRDTAASIDCSAP